VAQAAARSRWRQLAISAVIVLALVLVVPVLVEVYGSLDDIDTLGPGWLFAMVVASATQLVSFWELHRILLRTDAWFDVAAPHLAGNAASHVVPDGGPVGAGVQVRMMNSAGFALTRIVTAFGAITILGAVTNFIALPFVVIVASAIGGDVDARLITVLWVGAVVLCLVVVGTVWLALRDAPWRLLARAVSRACGWVRRVADAAEIERRLIAERDLIRLTLRGRLGAASLALLGSAFGDFAVLYLALRAIGAPVGLAPALAAFVVSNLLGLIPITPGGVGFVEAGMAGVLTVAGASSAQALLAVAAYRLIATWLPCLAGGIAFATFNHRHRADRPAALMTEV
jgi:uncharacterized protein (TIRG00374 family)